MKVIGYQKREFNVNDNGTTKTIKGYNIFCASELRDGVGMRPEDRFFASEYRLAECGYIPHVGDEIRVSFNQRGKLDYIVLI